VLRKLVRCGLVITYFLVSTTCLIVFRHGDDEYVSMQVRYLLIQVIDWKDVHTMECLDVVIV
jgi:hypothetical protein